MVEVAWSTSGLKVYTHRDGSAKVCETCCDGFVQSPYDCEYCPAGRTPLEITATISQTSDAVKCCGWFGDPPTWRHSVKADFGLAAKINGSHTLTQRPRPSLGVWPCQWEKWWTIGDGLAGTENVTYYEGTPGNCDENDPE